MGQLTSIATVWIITWRMAWPIIIGLAFFGILAACITASPSLRRQFPQSWLFPVMFVVPLTSIVWAGVFWAAEESLPASENHWRSISHSTLSLLGMVIAISIALWRRQAHRAWLIFVCAVFVVLFALAAWFVGAMAISNVWA